MGSARLLAVTIPTFFLFQVTKMSLRAVPNPHTNQILHEAEVWIKDGRGRKKLDLLVKYSARAPSGEEDNNPLRSSSTAAALLGEESTSYPLNG